MSHKILVVDDEKIMRDILTSFLERENYEVISASEGQEAVEIAKREHPDVILLDVRMPEIDGIETCKRLKAELTTKSIPVIMISGVGESMMEAVEAGAEDFLNKPFALAEVFTRVRSALRIRNLGNEIDRAMVYIEELQKKVP